MSDIDTTQYARLDLIKVWGVDTEAYGQNYNDGDIGMIAGSIRQFGFNRAVGLWKDQLDLDGNHAVMALRQIRNQGRVSQRETFPPANVVVDTDGKWWVKFYSLEHLPWERARAFAIATNRAAARASQDTDLLVQYLTEAREYDKTVYSATGYDDEDLARLLDPPIQQETVLSTPPMTAPDSFDASKLPGAPETGAIKPTFLIYVSMPDEETFRRMLRILTGKEPPETEAYTQTMAHVAWTQYHDYLERLEEVSDGIAD